MKSRQTIDIEMQIALAQMQMQIAYADGRDDLYRMWQNHIGDLEVLRQSSAELDSKENNDDPA